jgi:amino acid adenylation domain-containing protein
VTDVPLFGSGKNIGDDLFSDWRVRSRVASDAFLKEETEQSIQNRFELQVAKFPSRIAVKGKGVEISYAALNQAANRIACALTAESEQEGDRIVLLFKHEAAALAAMLGILKSGRVYVPLDPTYPLDRLKYILEDSQAALIVANDITFTLAEELACSKFRVLNIDEIDIGLSDKNPQPSVTPNKPAYILYTSGSTGLPKGVVQTHGNLLHLIRNYTNSISITENDRFSLLPSFSFAASLMDIYGALLNGASVHLYNIKEDGFSHISDWLVSEGITVYHSVPSLFRYFSNLLAEDKHLPDLRIIDLGGESVHIRDIELFKMHFAIDCVLVNNLACTEAGVFAQYFIDGMSGISGNTIPVGYATDGMEISLIDDEGNELDVNQIGEIAIKSLHLSPGYWRNHDLTSAAFSPPIDGTDRRTYITGDLGRRRPDGVLEHLGRKDFQIKIRGYRIEVAEIEAALEKMPEIEEAAVVGKKNWCNDIKLIAFIVPCEGKNPIIKTLRNCLKSRLPDYMIPSQFVFMDALPLAFNGKLDRNALLALCTIDRLPQREPFMAVRNETELRLAEIWAKLLRLRKVDVSDDFFELGGDSLMAMELVCWIEKEYGKKISPLALLKAPTILQLSAVISDSRTPKPVSCLVPIKPTGSMPPLFCLPSVPGSALLYRQIVKHLDYAQPVYGIEVSQDVLLKPLQEMASHYVNEIRKVLPEGPFFIIGFSAGGVMAFEMAQQLQRMHLKVPFLGLLDSVFPDNSNEKTPILSVSFLRNFPYWAYYFGPFWIKRYWRIARDWMRRNTDEPQQDFDMREVMRWTRNYMPERYPGRIVLFKAKAQGLFQVAPEKKWVNVCNSMALYIVPGNHLSIIKEPHASFLADKINVELQNAMKILHE